MTERMTRVKVLEAALTDIAGRFATDSKHFRWAARQKEPCDCVVCVARAALASRPQEETK